MPFIDPAPHLHVRGREQIPLVLAHEFFDLSLQEWVVKLRKYELISAHDGAGPALPPGGERTPPRRRRHKRQRVGSVRVIHLLFFPLLSLAYIDHNNLPLLERRLVKAVHIVRLSTVVWNMYGLDSDAKFGKHWQGECGPCPAGSESCDLLLFRTVAVAQG